MPSSSIIVHPKPAVRQSPLRFLYALTARLRSVDGPRMETDLQIEALDEMSAGLAGCSAASACTESAVDGFCRLRREAFSDGKITPAELRTLDRALLGLKHNAHTTTKKIESLR